MWSWLKKLWGSFDSLEPKTKRRINVGRVDVTLVTNDDVQYKFHFAGTCRYVGDCSKSLFSKAVDGNINYEAFTISANNLFELWQERSAKTMMASVGDNTYVSMHNVNFYVKKHSDRFIELEEPK